MNEGAQNNLFFKVLVGARSPSDHNRITMTSFKSNHDDLALLSIREKKKEKSFPRSKKGTPVPRIYKSVLDCFLNQKMGTKISQTIPKCNI